MSRRTRLVLLACLCLAAAGAGGWWYFHISRPEYRLRRGQELVRAGRYQAAEATAASLEADGHQEAALLLRGETLLSRGETQDRTEDVIAALGTLNQIHAEGSMLVEAAALSGRCMLRLGNLLEAERAFSFVLTQDPDFLDAHRGLMAVYYDLGALTHAMSHAQKWAELAPRDGRPHRFMGLMYKDMGNYQEAVAPYRAALERELKGQVHEEVNIELAECLIRGTKHAAAYETLASSRPPEELLARVRTAQAECQRMLGHPELSRELVAQALEVSPRYTDALRVRAQLALDADEPTQAVSDLERAAALAPNEFDTQHMLGRAYGRLGEEKKALAARQRVKEIQGRLDELSSLTRETIDRPKDAKLHQRLADIYAQMGMPEMAAARRRVAALLTEPATASRGVTLPPP